MNGHIVNMEVSWDKFSPPDDYIKQCLWRDMTNWIRNADLAGVAFRFSAHSTENKIMRSTRYSLKAEIITIQTQSVVLEHKYDTKYIPNLKLTFGERLRFLFSGKLKKEVGNG